MGALGSGALPCPQSGRVFWLGRSVMETRHRGRQLKKLEVEIGESLFLLVPLDSPLSDLGQGPLGLSLSSNNAWKGRQ